MFLSLFDEGKRLFFRQGKKNNFNWLQELKQFWTTVNQLAGRDLNSRRV